MKLKKNIAISESGFVFDPNSGDSFSINPIAAEIIGFIKQEKTADEIQSAILDKYDVDTSSFEKYFYDFINMLKQYNLLEDHES